MPYPLTDRRRFLTLSGAMAAAWLADRPQGIVLAQPKLSNYPFTLGVASGDPTPDGFVLWTRLAPEPITGGGMPRVNVVVDWIVTEDEALTKVVARGATTATPEFAHSVHVEVAGLRPDRWYWYQFRVGNETSPKGRARTMPAADATPDKLCFAFASCQHYESGHYTAYQHLVAESPDLILHLGDYIYESPPRKIGAIRMHCGTGELNTLADYRNRHAQYKTDLLLQAAHAAAPWLVTWDDHEVENNYANAISQQSSVTSEEFLKRRARAYQAYYEHMPLRRTSLPSGADMLLYRTCDFGRLARFDVLDTRQYRTDQPCGDKNTAPCGEEMNPNGTMLGKEQEAWLSKQLTTSPATWNVLAQQVMFARVDRKAGMEEAYSMDQWPGYEFERRKIMRFLLENKIANPLILTGDIHCNWANNIALDEGGKSLPVATELVGTSIASGGDGIAEPRFLKELYAENPAVKFHNSERGYVICRMTTKQYEAQFRTVEYVKRLGAPIQTRAKFVVEAGRPELMNG